MGIISVSSCTVLTPFLGAAIILHRWHVLHAVLLLRNACHVMSDILSSTAQVKTVCSEARADKQTSELVRMCFRMLPWLQMMMKKKKSTLVLLQRTSLDLLIWTWTMTGILYMALTHRTTWTGQLVPKFSLVFNRYSSDTEHAQMTCQDDMCFHNSDV